MMRATPSMLPLCYAVELGAVLGFEPGAAGMSLVSSPACSLSIVVVPVVTEKRTVSPTTRSESWASPFLSMSLLLVTVYVVVPVDVLIDTEVLPTAVTVPLWSSIPPWCSWASGMPSFSCTPGPPGVTLLDALVVPVAGAVGVVVAAFADIVPASTAPASTPPATNPAPVNRVRRLLVVLVMSFLLESSGPHRWELPPGCRRWLARTSPHGLSQV